MFYQFVVVSIYSGLSSEQTQDGEVKVVRILKSDMIQLPTTTENRDNLPTSLEVADSRNIKEVGSKPVNKNPTSVPTTCNVISGSLSLKDNGRSRAVKNVKPRPTSDAVDAPQRSRSEQLCAICGKMFRKLKSHMRLHRRPDYQCMECGRKFSRKDYLNEHQRVHSNERPFLCVECGLSFRAAGHLRHHLLIHSGERQYQCDQCGKSFRRSGHRNEHVRNVHEGVKAYRCWRCPRSFATTTALKLHVMGHTNERPHACPSCPKRFKSARVLEVHLITHSGERPFPCAICGRRFTQRSAVRMHEATQHTADGGRCHECELCGQRFSKRSIRDAHVRRHRGEKPHTCTICYWSFAFLGDLRNHMIKKHKVRRNAAAETAQQQGRSQDVRNEEA